MSETKQILDSIINDFSTEKFNLFFRRKTQGKFREINQNYQQYDDSEFKNGLKLGEVEFGDGKLLVCAFEVQKSLSERSGKKAQYEKAKSILKSAENQVYSVGIFIFYDQSGNFRFSLVYPESIGTRRQWNHFKRFTYFVSQEFTNKTFLQRIGDGDFSTLVKIKEAFSVEKVTKEFYQDIANWYFWAVLHCQFPEGAEKAPDGKDNISVIRLITRMIFIWFMREQGLINKDLFAKQQIENVLKNLDDNESSYYKAILQNLFFATLSTKKKERKFRKPERFQGKNKDYGNQYVFRYHDLFKKSGNLNKYFEDIPFLNGGLFECLDEGRNNNYYVDGFTERKEFQPKVPNLLFFGAEQNVNLSEYLGPQSKKSKVRGLLDILSSFNFTIDENSPDDADIALDPELLGRVFENLLASFNPETSTTARKATGSYYTPREIVDYMVAESLKAYFKTHLSDVEKIDEKLEQLFSNESSENPFDEKQSKKLVELIESVKIVDPAVGSGAFPMGALNKLVFILNKVDPGNKLWKEAQLKATDVIPDTNVRNKIKKEIESYFGTKQPDYWRKLYLIQNCIYGVDIQQIAVEITKLRFFISLLVDEDKDDIQPLPNLDFKIMQGNSLLEEYEGIKLFDEKLLEDQEPLQKQIEEIKNKQSKLQSEYLSLHTKNQLTKTRQAGLNTELKNLAKQLKKLALPKKEEEIAGLFDAQDEAKQKRETLKKLHKQFFEASDKKEKDNIREQIHKIEWDLIEATLKKENKLSKLKDLEKFKKSKNRPFFLWKLYFAEVFEKDGFDIVIANPPYIKEYTQRSAFDGLRNSVYYQGKMDLWYLFACKSIDFLKNNTGVISFIAQNNWTTSYGASKLRNKVIDDTQILYLVDFGDYKIFECAGIQTMVMIFQKNKQNQTYKFDYRRLKNGHLTFQDVLALLQKYQNEQTEYIKPNINRIETQNQTLTFSDSNKEKLLNKIKEKQNFKLDANLEVAQGIVFPQNKINKASQAKLGKNYCVGEGIFVLSNNEKESLNLTETELNLIKPSYTTKEISRYYANPKNQEWVIYTDSSFKDANKIKQYPNLKKHLDQFKSVITSDNKPYGLHRVRDEKFFIGEKIIATRKCVKPSFSYVNFDSYVSATFYVIKTERLNLKYLIALLNSGLFEFWLKNKGKMQGNNFQIDKEPLLNLPILKPSESAAPFITLVDQILAITKSADYLQNPDKQAKVKGYEEQIDELVYKLYGLTTEEIKIVESKN